MIQLARPHGNDWQRFRWRHRYFLVTLGVCFGLVFDVRTWKVHPDPGLISRTGFTSFLIALPVALALWTAYAFTRTLVAFYARRYRDLFSVR